MSTIHFLNVREGDCTWIQHDSNRNTVIDISNGNDVDNLTDDEIDDKLDEFLEIEDLVESTEAAVLGNFGQKNHPVDPIKYIKQFLHNKTIFRFILTHPDMDHMDGIKRFFDVFEPINFWDTKNNKQIPMNGKWGRYKKDDWMFYQKIRQSAKFYYAGNHCVYYNKDEYGGNGDDLYVLAPTEELVREANESEDYNDCSYVIMYRPYGYKIIFAGDSSSKTWDYILREYKEDVSDVDILLAPHHGRKTGGNAEYLDVLKPQLTIFGNAESAHMNYSSWNNKNLKFVTNNKAGYIVCKITQSRINVFVSNKKFAQKSNPSISMEDDIQAWYLLSLVK